MPVRRLPTETIKQRRSKHVRDESACRSGLSDTYQEDMVVAFARPDYAYRTVTEICRNRLIMINITW